jgi:hypothetical protein
MVRIIWKGEDTESVPGPSFNTWNGVRFEKGRPVEISDPAMIASARENQFYKVEDNAKTTQDEGQKFPASEDKKEKLKKAGERKEFKKVYDYREGEKGTGYKPKKKKAKAKAGDRDADTEPALAGELSDDHPAAHKDAD